MPILAGFVFASGPEGRQDLQGIWNSSSGTPLERPAELKARNSSRRKKRPSGRRRWTRAASRTSNLFTRGVGTYNDAFWEIGVKPDGTSRTSMIYDPPDGRLPALTPAAAAAREKRLNGKPASGRGEGPGAARPLPAVSHRCAADDSLQLQQQLHDRADAGLRRDLPRRWCTIRGSFRWTGVRIFPQRFACGWVIRWGTGKATRWWWIRRIFPTRRGLTGPTTTCMWWERFKRMGCGDDSLSVRRGRSNGVYETVERRTDHVSHARPHVRICVPRRKLRSNGFAAWRAGSGERREIGLLFPAAR